ncbi:MAG: aldo/keto reductase [Ruminococcus sp.]|nr:aldo/keto reductase [Ruminococcus sp.]
MLKENYRLYNGVKIPKIALGTWQISDSDVIGTVNNAISIGYRHIDTAVQYENERGIGQAVKECGVARNELFVTTKIPHDVKSYEGAKQTIEDSLNRMGLEYLDLVLIHSPKPWEELFAGSDKTYFEENLAVWKAMTEAYQSGKVRAIGVSNFEISDIQNLIDHSNVKPMVNQIRVHIGHMPTEIINYCQTNDILVEAFSPNATGKLIGNPAIEALADKYGVSVPQLSIRYDLQLGLLPLPKSTSKDHMKQNAELDFEISDKDMTILGKVEEIQSL